MPERGGRGPEQSRESYKKLFLNKWSALLGVLVVVLGIKFGWNEEKKEEMKDKIDSTLRLDESELPEDEDEAKRAVEAVKSLHRALQDAAARHDAEDGGVSVPMEDENKLEPKVVSSELVKSTPTRLIMKETRDDGSVVYRIHDLTVPDEETATDENYKAIQDYFKSDCPGWSVERENQWEYKAMLGSSGNWLWIQVEEDGSYTVGSLTGLEDERNVNSMADIAKVLRDKEEILKLNDQLRDEKITTQEFKEKLKEMGYLPAGWDN